MDARAMGLLTLLLGALALAWHLGAGSLPRSDDTIYAQMAREMVAGGDWLRTPWMGTSLFEKPPLLFWLLGLSGSTLGWTPLAMRLPGALAGALSLVYVYRLARGAGVGPRGAAVAVAATTASVVFTMTARRTLTDPLLVAAALGALDHAWRGHAKRAGLYLALGALAKSVAVGPAALAVAWVLWRRRRGTAGVTAAATAAGVAAVPFGAWLAAMAARHGAAFWDTALGYHVAARVGTALVGTDDPLYYARVGWEQDGWLAAALGGGLVAGLIAALVAWARARQSPHREVSGGGDDAPTSAGVPGAVPYAVKGPLLAAWLTLVALQVTHTRLFHYLMPVIPLAAITGAWAARRLLRRPSAAWLAWAGAVAAFTVGPLPTHVARPDYAPDSVALARGPLSNLPPNARVFVWEDYDPALAFLLDRRVEILTAHRPFYDLQQRVDMMRRAHAVRWASPETLATLAADPRPLVAVAPRARAAGLVAWAERLHRAREVSVEEAAGHVVLRVAAGTSPGAP